MSDQNDDAQDFATMVLAGVVALVVAGVIASAVATTMRNAATAAPSVDQEALGSATLPAMPAGDVAIEPEGRIYFELGSAAMPAAAAEVLGRVADAARRVAPALKERPPPRPARRSANRLPAPCSASLEPLDDHGASNDLTM